MLTAPGPNPQPQPSTHETHFNQFARVDEGLWAWHFVLRDAQGEGIASINRAFRGFGREVRCRPRIPSVGANNHLRSQIFTDTGQYNVSFRAPEQVYSLNQQSGVILHKPAVPRNLSIDERAVSSICSEPTCCYMITSSLSWLWQVRSFYVSQGICRW